MTINTKTLNKQYAQSIYDNLDMINGIISEKGWESLDTYAKDSFKNYNGLLNTLQLLDVDLYLKAVKEAKMYGIIN